MKKIILVAILMGVAMSAMAQLSPYVEASGVVNNTKFKASVQRVSPLARPVPIHVAGSVTNRTIAPRFVIAKVDYQTVMSWAVASGWTTDANTTANSTVASSATGCNAYFELGLGSGVGTWRLPTQRELMIIYLCRKEFSLSNLGFVDLVLGSYWSSTSNGNLEAWAMDFSDGSMLNRTKTSNFRTRCIRDL